MKFKIDENLPSELVQLLGEAGHDGRTVCEQGLSGASDSAVVAACREEARILVTADLDLSDLRHYPPENYPGFIVLRLHRQVRDLQIATMRRILPLLSTTSLENCLWIVEETRIRIRGSDKE